jgi:hypothetical protein
MVGMYVEACGAGLDLRGGMAGQDWRQLAGGAEDDQVAWIICGVVRRSLDRVIFLASLHRFPRQGRRGVFLASGL